MSNRSGSSQTSKKDQGLALGFDIGMGAAFGAGLLSFISPCILPIVPFYLCYMAGQSFERMTDDGAVDMGPVRRQAVLSAVMFSLGVITIFMGLGATASVFGQQLREWFDVLRYAAAAIVLMLGLHFLGILRIPFLYRQMRMELGEARPAGLLGAYLIGLAFAFGWTPCVGPVLAAILFMAASTDTAGQGAGLLLVYALGMTLPFVVAAAFIGPFMRWAQGFRRHLGKVEKILGGAMVAFAVLIATDSMNVIANWMIETFPVFMSIG